MINNKLNIDEIIIRYLDGTATDSDKEQLLTWLKESDKNLHSYSEFRDVWFASQSNSSVHSDMEKALKAKPVKPGLTAILRQATWGVGIICAAWVIVAILKLIGG